MKHAIQFTMGYLGYFVIGFMALRAMIIKDDIVGFVLLDVGVLLLINYVSFLEKSHVSPKYSGYIKLILIVALLIRYLQFYSTNGCGSSIMRSRFFLFQLTSSLAE